MKLSVPYWRRKSPATRAEPSNATSSQSSVKFIIAVEAESEDILYHHLGTRIDGSANNGRQYLVRIVRSGDLKSRSDCGWDNPREIAFIGIAFLEIVLR
jgi:hypothetical protein